LMVGSLVVLSRWHSPERFMRVMALLFASANAGSLVATLPLASATAAFGWRGTFVGLGVLCAVLTVLFFAVVRDAPAGASPRTASNATLWATVVDYRRVFDIRDLLYVAPMVAVGYASVITVLGLWGGPYLHDVYGLSAVERGNVLAIMAIAMIAGTLFYGPLDKRFNSRKLVVFGGAAATAVLFLVLAVMPNLPLIATTVLLALISFVGSYSLVTMAHGLALFTGDMAGRGSTTLNLCLMGGAAAIQSATGWVIGVMTSGETGASSAPYAAVFLFLGLVTALALAAYCRAGDIKPASRAK
ncbi:MAG: MFS transporter, partial [Alphaproteobacteria bacterium]|nr:MFS transporter [Alphaproteobacteria bacterium]